MISELPGQLMNDLLEYDRIDILPQHVQQEPISHLGLLDDDIDAFLFDESEPNVEQVSPHSRRENNHGPVNQNQ